MKRTTFLVLVLGFYTILLGIAALANIFGGQPVVPTALSSNINWPWVTKVGLVGIIFGVLMAFLGSRIATFSRLYELLQNMFASTKMIDLVIVSLLAGVCEEYLFRYTLVPLMGGIGSTLVFAAAHGALDVRKNWQRGYLVFLILGGWGLFHVFQTWGLLTAMVIHFSYDLGFLLMLRSGRAKKKGCPLPDSP